MEEELEKINLKGKEEEIKEENGNGNGNEIVVERRIEEKKKRVSESRWFNQMKRDFGEEGLSKRFTVVPWYRHYVSLLNFSARLGRDFGDKLKKQFGELA